VLKNSDHIFTLDLAFIKLAAPGHGLYILQRKEHDAKQFVMHGQGSMHSMTGWIKKIFVVLHKQFSFVRGVCGQTLNSL
jgi:hypothetical protein